MIFLPTEEMKELEKIFEPYRDEHYNFVQNTPDEVKEAYKKYLELSRKQYDDEVASWFE
ncbi:MAG: hypothetical protein ACLT5F_09155 [Anaerotignaceae bacterium]